MSVSLRCWAGPRWARQGFTLVELLVVIAIMGILIALLLPAVQSAREAARRTQCTNNLKNLGLGCITYASVNKRLPPGKVLKYDPGTGAGCSDPGANGGYSNWALEILPFIEEKALFQEYNFDLPNSNSANAKVVGTNLKIMTCPSDPNGSRKVEPENDQAGDHLFAVGSYKGVAGRAYSGNGAAGEAYWDSGKASVNGVGLVDRGPLPLWFVNPSTCYMASIGSKRIRLSDIKDGTSKTMLIGEYTTISRDSRSALWANSHFSNNLASITLPGSCKTDPMNCSTTVNGETYASAMDPDYDKCSDAGAIAGYGTRPCRCAFTGFHGGRGAINFVFCDGSVRRVINTSDLRILAALTTINGSPEPANQMP